jgi:CheY-like chemotaxis protein
LASAYAIVAEHRGRIACHSELGQGTTFEIELPPANLAAPKAELHEPALAGGGTETVLIIDDEALVRRAVRGILERAGYRVLESSGGVEGIATLARESVVDALILDRSMPGMSGDEVLAKLSALGNRLPVILLSGMPGPSLTLDRRSVALVKPPDPASLLRALRQVLDVPATQA